MYYRYADGNVFDFWTKSLVLGSQFFSFRTHLNKYSIHFILGPRISQSRLYLRSSLSGSCFPVPPLAIEIAFFSLHCFPVLNSKDTPFSLWNSIFENKKKNILDLLRSQMKIRITQVHIYTTPDSCRAMMKKLVECGALTFCAAPNANLKIYWNAEPCHILERWALIKRGSELGARSKNRPEHGALETPGQLLQFVTISSYLHLDKE